MPTFDFEDGLFPSSFKNADEEPWQNTTEDSNGGTHSLSANNTVANRQISSCYILGDFDAGDFDCDYKVSSESGFDFGYIVVDGVAVVNQVSGSGSWTAMTTQSLSAGFHVIQFVFCKDNSSSSGTDTLYIDNVVLPNFTPRDADVDYIDLSETVFTVDPLGTWVNATGGANNAPFIGAQSTVSGGSGNRSLTYTSPSDSPAGIMAFIGFANAASGQTVKFFVDSIEVFSDTGNFYAGSSSNLRAPLGHVQAVSAGSHNYEIRATDGAAARAYLFYEPSFTEPSGITGSGALASQSATMAGTAKLEHTASGSLLSQSATTSGAGTVGGVITGSGTLQSQSATMSGVAELEHTGSGSLISQSATMAGTAELEHPGSGSLISQPAVMNGVAELEHTASGSLISQSATTSGDATLEGKITGSGSLQSQSATMVGTAELEHPGSGSLISQSATISGTAELEHTTSGALLSQSATMSGEAFLGAPISDFKVNLTTDDITANLTTDGISSNLTTENITANLTTKR